MIRYFLLVVAAVAIGITSCSKEVNNSNTDVSNQQVELQDQSKSSNNVITLTSQEIIAIANEHNQYLSQIFNNFNFSSSDLEQELYNQIMANPISGYNSQQMNSVYNMAAGCDRTAVLNSLNDPVAVAYIDNADILVSNSTSIQQLNQNIDQLVNTAINDATVTEKDAVALYCEVLKKSAYYWSPMSFGGGGEGDIILNGGGQPGLSPFWSIVIGDAVGAVMGTVATGPLGGAVLGGAVSSMLAVAFLGD